jgi:hypothetical protein
MDRSEAPVNATTGVEADIERQGGLPPGMRGTDAAAAVLCVLAQRLSGGEARDLVVTLPEGLRPRVQACARHRASAGRHLITTNSCGVWRHTWTSAGLRPRTSPAPCSRPCGGRYRSRNSRMSLANCRGTSSSSGGRHWIEAVKCSACHRRPDAERAKEVQRRLQARNLPTLPKVGDERGRLREDI